LLAIQQHYARSYAASTKHLLSIITASSNQPTTGRTMHLEAVAVATTKVLIMFTTQHWTTERGIETGLRKLNWHLEATYTYSTGLSDFCQTVIRLRASGQ
jgi:hypothetical protein